MTEFTIRESTVEDVPEFARVRAIVTPWQGASVATQVNWFRNASPAAKALRLCAEVDGRIAGFGNCGLNVTTSQVGACDVGVMVVPEFRGRGIGGALLDRFEAHLRSVGGLRARGGVAEGPGLDWVKARGYELGASERFSVVDPQVLPPLPATPDGVTVVSLAEITPEAAHELDTAAFADEPGDVPYDGMSFTDFMTRVWNGPDLDKYVSVVAIVDGMAVSSVLLDVNRETGWSMSGGTGTLPAYRGRGIAKLLKSVSLRRAAEVGVTAAYTSNDYSNAPMLAINDWLGYRVTDTQWACLKDLA
ncbi:N-acetyltransferase [Longispora fulva]|uniref:GNAT superfamily N-acetyltransferase n=1 Tax=Longispora fulva TaxID=619741 RepID=A0A8J7KLS1_9ACTN|nr:GNAT family N-acetyltransferase [Longispora fulva]MBG6139699.1 GNAT superfamily N-acetyltransferase [Longispora fulva]GIG57918.1 N-acetyltransferase [Longispora fulva]